MNRISKSQIKVKSNKTLKLMVMLQVFAILGLAILVLLPKAQAQEVVEHTVVEAVELDPAQLDRILAPIALYPDALLSQILVASTYPLEIVQASRWRAANSSLSEVEVISAVDDQNWDPSVRALAPYGDLLDRLSEDLGWLQSLGDAFLSSEDQVLARVQGLRQAAQENGSIADNEYYDVVEEQDNIIIESTRREIVYVPYYDTRSVYGSSYWYGYQPVYWNRPLGYTHLRGGLYWNSSFYVRPSLFFGGFHWGNRNLVVDNYYYDRPYSSNYYYYPSSRGYNYQHWTHNPAHRGGVRYPQKVVKSYSNVRSQAITSNRSIQRSAPAATRSGFPSMNKSQKTVSSAVRNQNTRQTTITRPTTTSRVINRQPSYNVIKQQSAPRPSYSPSTSSVQRRTSTRVQQPAPRAASSVNKNAVRSTSVQRVPTGNRRTDSRLK